MAHWVKSLPAMQETQEMRVQSLSWEDSPESGEGNGKPLQYSCLGNPMDRGVWLAAADGVTKELGLTEQLSACAQRR